jgi:hypothetical protein
MRTKRRNTASAVAAVAMLALALGSQPAAQAGSDTVPPGASGEGIKVHGRWTIDIKNADGSLVSHHEFQNALADGGQALVNLLAGSSAGGWSIHFTAGSSAVSPCQGGTGGRSPNWCSVIPTNFTPSGTAQFATLTTAPTTSSFTLNGTATALVAGEIGRVSTSVAVCIRSETGESCASRGFENANLFTDVSLGFPGKPPVIQVAAGQIVQIRVVISFS